MRNVTSAILLLVILEVASAVDKPKTPRPPPPGGVKREVKGTWFRTEPLGETPKRVADAFPLSDQEKTGGWSRFEPMSDEFNGDQLDLAKWSPQSLSSPGRPPGLFREANVSVSGGQLHLVMRKEEVPPEFEKKGYHDYTCAKARSTALVRYGCFEIRAQPMNSAGSSSFWFAGSGDGWRTEIDVFEIGGKSKGYDQKYNMHLHVFYTPTDKEHWKLGEAWVAPWRLADDYHVYGLDWNEKELVYYVDGVAVWKVPNTHWHQPLSMIFDSETMGNWFGMPDDKDLPSTYHVDYVRAWKKDAPVTQADPMRANRRDFLRVVGSGLLATGATSLARSRDRKASAPIASHAGTAPGPAGRGRQMDQLRASAVQVAGNNHE